jgi:hypothetical protein
MPLKIGGPGSPTMRIPLRGYIHPSYFVIFLFPSFADINFGEGKIKEIKDEKNEDEVR